MEIALSTELLDNIDTHSAMLEETVNSIVAHYSSELDEYVEFIMSLLMDDSNPPTDLELDDFCMRLSTLIYFTSTGCEQLGIRDDLSKSAYKDAYNTARAMIQKGTVADKNAQAEIDSLQEHLVAVVYNKSYKILKAKVESAQEILASVKKVMSRRISEQELSRIQTNN